MYNNDPCPICGGTDFSWGHLRGKPRVAYTADGDGFVAWFMGWRRKTVNARHCDRCGNVQLFTAPVFDFVDQKEKPKRE